MAKIAFLGAGNMASAMVDGLLASGAAVKADLACLGGSDPTAATLSARTGIRRADTLEELLTGAEALVVAFKPQHLDSASPALADLTADCLVVSILAGKRLAQLARVFSRARNVVRFMPNTPGKIGAGITGWCALRDLDSADRQIVGSLLGSLGKSIETSEDKMNAITGLSGSGPAYVFEFAAALRDAGIAAGLPSADSETLAIETLLGASRLLAQRRQTPEQLRDEVTSPNGTTFAALQRLTAGGFRNLIRETVIAAKARAEELSKDS